MNLENMTEEQKLRRMAELQKQDKIAANRLYYQESRDRLEKIACKKVQTAMIGALDNFEIEFGYLWNHGAKFNELTDEQKRMRKKWNKARSDILTKGNDQIRAIEKELKQYTVRWDRYQVEYKVENNG